MLTLITTSPQATHELGRCLAGALRIGDVIALQGNLGAGKTVFVQGLGEGLHALGRVTSPTFVIMRRHKTAETPAVPALYHVDAYRLTGGLDLLDMGLEDWLDDGAVAVEWPENVGDALPADCLEVRFEYHDDDRVLTVIAHGPRSRELLEHLRQCGY